MLVTVPPADCVHSCTSSARTMHVNVPLWLRTFGDTVTDKPPTSCSLLSRLWGEMQRAEKRMGQDKHDFEKHSLAKTLVGKPGLPWWRSRDIQGGVEIVAG